MGCQQSGSSGAPADDPNSLNTQLVAAITANDLEGVRFLLQEGADPCFKNVHGNPCLHLAAARGFTEILKLLLEAGCPVDIKSEDLFSDLLGCEAIHVVGAMRNRSDDSVRASVQVLLDHGADINAQTSMGNTVLHRMLAVHYFSAIFFLLDHDDCQIDIKNVDFQTPLDMAKVLLKTSTDPELTETWQKVVDRMHEKLEQPCTPRPDPSQPPHSVLGSDRKSYDSVATVQYNCGRKSKMRTFKMYSVPKSAQSQARLPSGTGRSRAPVTLTDEQARTQLGLQSEPLREVYQPPSRNNPSNAGTVRSRPENGSALRCSQPVAS
eukprot:gnl/Spiro4/27548_TR13698_c0_g1_i1.p1 gnl/Spiro4/27548_TR13698_c0_g1~~gnl/Spiro4/27548_TR13698_c0_g1_i1.p1  ORF type:complete len:323 (+),score=90.69 gnl/Spiro4/27548_TR13698_c0_g1_i1:115-1083(+)